MQDNPTINTDGKN